jgi:hypothetical protein
MRGDFVEFNQSVGWNSSCLSTALSTVAVNKSGEIEGLKMGLIAHSKHKLKSVLLQELDLLVRTFSTA